MKQPSVQIQVLGLSDVRQVDKPWGWERWIADGSPVFPYALKEIFIKAPHRSSLQVHRQKQETNYVQKGRGMLYYSKATVDVAGLESGHYTEEELRELVSSLERQELLSGTVFHIFPGFIHRVEALEDLSMIEASTIELDDVIRLQDDTGRGSGRIEAEHRRRP